MGGDNGTDHGKGGTNDAPLLSSSTLYPQGLGKCLAYLPLSFMEGQFEWKNKEWPSKMQLCKYELCGQSACWKGGYIQVGDLKVPHRR